MTPSRYRLIRCVADCDTFIFKGELAVGAYYNNKFWVLYLPDGRLRFVVLDERFEVKP